MKIDVPAFSPRDYQKPLVEAFQKKGYRNLMAVWPRRCLSGISHILMANGSFKFLKDIEIGDEILSWNGKKFVKDTVKNKWKTGLKKTKRTKAGFHLPIITSEDHVFAYRNERDSKVNWKPLKDIGNFARLLNYGGIGYGKTNNPDLAEFLGYMITDGYVSHYQQPKFTNVNVDILKRVEELAFKLFGYKAIWREKGNGYDLGFSNGTRGGGTFKNKIKELFRDDGMDVPNYEKRLLPIIWDFDEESLHRFFAAAISGDGSIYTHKQGFKPKDSARPNRNTTVTAACEITINCGKSYNLGWDFYWLFRKIGIVPQTPYCEHGSNWKIRVTKQDGIKRLLSHGPIYGKTDRQQIALQHISNFTKNSKQVDSLFASRYKSEEYCDEDLYDIETSNHHNFVANGYLVHNSGKDWVAFQLLIWASLAKPGVYFIIYPTYSQGRKILWESMTNDGKRFLDMIPKEAIVSVNNTEMKIRLINQSLLCVIGSDNIDSIVGTNCIGCVYSEMALQSEAAMQMIRPILAANGGWCIMISTPRGKNFFYEIYKVACEKPDWFVSYLTLDDTCHIPLSEIERDRDEGLMPETLIRQEYYCDWNMGITGSFFGKMLDKMRLTGQIGKVIYDPTKPCHVSIDIGWNDPTACIFFQVVGNSINIIDYYENNKEPLEHYVDVIKNRGYKNIGTCIGPHDLRQHNIETGNTRWMVLNQLGLTFQVAPSISIEDGITAAQGLLSRVCIDEKKCERFIKILENYRAEYNPKREAYSRVPLHNFASHGADAYRYLAISLHLIETNDSTPEQLDKRYRDSVYGPNTFDPRNFNPLHQR